MQEHQSSTRRSRVSSLCGFFFHGPGPCYLLSAAFAFLLTIFAPLDYFVINQEEFWFDIYALLPLIAVSFGLCCLLGCLIYTLFYKFAPKAVPFAMILHITVLLFLYIQGNFLTGSLGRLTGEAVDWSAFRLQNLLSLFIFLLLLCVFILLLIKKKEIFPGLIANLSLFFTAFFLLCLLFEILPRAKTVCRPQTETVLTYEKVMEFSKEKNLILFLLDQTDSREVAGVLEETPAYRETFRDFVFFRDAMSGYGHTKFSIAQMFTGKWYENTGNFHEFYEEGLNRSKLLNSLKDRGWRIGMYGEVPKEALEIPFENLKKCSCVVSSYPVFARCWADMLLYRYLPYCLKGRFEPDSDALDNCKKLDPEYQRYSWSNLLFYDLLKDTPFTFSGTGSMKYIHLKGAHSHYDLDETLTEIEEVPFEEGGYHMAVRGGLKLAEKFLEKLKEEGLYDNSAILILADHGYDRDDADGFSESPLLMIKGMNEHHPMLDNMAPVSYADLPEALLRLSEGADALSGFDCREGDSRLRRFLYYSEYDVEHMYEYELSGRVHDKSTFLPTGNVYVKP